MRLKGRLTNPLKLLIPMNCFSHWCTEADQDPLDSIGNGFDLIKTDNCARDEGKT